jgi:uncharacterized protein YuzE
MQIASPSVRIGPHAFDHISYDDGGDVLYLSVGEPREAADCEETPEGHVIRYDGHQHIIGVSIINAKWILDHVQAVALTLPKQPGAAGPGRQVQIEPSALLAEIIHPMAEMPKECQVTDDGQRAQNWVAAVHRSRARTAPGQPSSTSPDSDR